MEVLTLLFWKCFSIILFMVKKKKKSHTNTMREAESRRVKVEADRPIMMLTWTRVVVVEMERN